ncbi:MAG: hypothetical protein ACRD5F_04765, partial [Candidatus Acidiferrales bacterium]
MNCEDYRDALSGAALGPQADAAPRAPRDAALRAHLDACAVCRAELERLRALTSAIDAGLAQIVSADPSPAFAARIRARIAERADERASRWHTWARAIAGAMAIVALVAWLATRSAPGPRGPSRNTAATPTPALAPPGANAEPDLTPPPPDKRIDIARHTPQPIRSPRPRRPAAKINGPSLPEVLVTGDEWRQVAKLYALAQKGEANTEALTP